MIIQSKHRSGPFTDTPLLQTIRRRHAERAFLAQLLGHLRKLVRSCEAEAINIEVLCSYPAHIVRQLSSPPSVTRMRWLRILLFLSLWITGISARSAGLLDDDSVWNLQARQVNQRQKDGDTELITEILNFRKRMCKTCMTLCVQFWVSDLLWFGAPFQRASLILNTIQYRAKFSL